MSTCMVALVRGGDRHAPLGCADNLSQAIDMEADKAMAMVKMAPVVGLVWANLQGCH